MDIQATIDAVKLLDDTRFEKHPGDCNVVTGILYRAARHLDKQAKAYLTGEAK